MSEDRLIDLVRQVAAAYRDGVAEGERRAAARRASPCAPDCVAMGGPPCELDAAELDELRGPDGRLPIRNHDYRELARVRGLRLLAASESRERLALARRHVAELLELVDDAHAEIDRLRELLAGVRRAS